MAGRSLTLEPPSLDGVREPRFAARRPVPTSAASDKKRRCRPLASLVGKALRLWASVWLRP